jgi:hypothetical protein
VQGLSRRKALAGLAVLPVALPAAAAAEPDPIFAVIERHRQLSELFTAAVDVSSRLEGGPEFEAADAISAERNQALMGHADALIRSIPTTMAGVIALARYVASLDEWQTPGDDREIWDEPSPSWHQVFLNTTATAIEAMIRRGAA